MISHLVLMTPRPDLSDDERQSFLALFERALREIPDVRGVRIGRQVLHGAGYESLSNGGGQYLAIIDFDDLAGLQAYLRHPAHEELGARFYAALSSAIVADFDVAGIEGLERLVRPTA